MLESDNNDLQTNNILDNSNKFNNYTKCENPNEILNMIYMIGFL